MLFINEIFSLILLVDVFSFYLSKELTGTNIGAYLKTPDPRKFEYRLGNGIGGFEDSYSIDAVRSLMEYAGYRGMRKKLREDLFETWGYGIELGVCEINDKHGILDVVGYLAKPPKSHSSNKTEDSELCYPDHLYEPIWLENGEVNPNNYWANFVYKTVSTYKDYIKIWETWNEPDYVLGKDNVDTNKWETSPPNPNYLRHWYGTIYEYIRLLRITYEVAKKVDPDCWVATGGIAYPYFLDGIMRYTDNPDGGKLTEEYPAYGGAYFDCDAFHKYPNWGSYDMQTKESIDDNGSDSHAKKVVTLKKNHQYIIKKYGFGDKYPEKIFICTETGLSSEGGVGGDLVRRNWIIKLDLLMIEYDIKQIHELILSDGGGGSGDYEKVQKFVSLEESYKYLKSSSKGRATLKKLNLGKYTFDKEKTTEFRESLPENVNGIVLKRKFPKEENEEYYYDYFYSVWIICVKNEVEGQISTKLNIPSDALKFDWLGNKEKKGKNSQFEITSTPIFLLLNENKGLSAVAIFFIILFSLIGVVFLAFLGLYAYKRIIRKQNIPLDKNIFGRLLEKY